MAPHRRAQVTWEMHSGRVCCDAVGEARLSAFGHQSQTPPSEQSFWWVTFCSCCWSTGSDSQGDVSSWCPRSWPARCIVNRQPFGPARHSQSCKFPWTVSLKCCLKLLRTCPHLRTDPGLIKCNESFNWLKWAGNQTSEANGAQVTYRPCTRVEFAPWRGDLSALELQCYSTYLQLWWASPTADPGETSDQMCRAATSSISLTFSGSDLSLAVALR